MHSAVITSRTRPLLELQSVCAQRRQMEVQSLLCDSHITNCSPAQELERLEVERVEMIRQHLCQYTTLRHETDMFNQSVSTTNYFAYTSRGSHLTSPLCVVSELSVYCDASSCCCSMFVQTMEPVDKLLQCVDPVRDRELWVRENKTGDIRPVDIEIWPQRCPTPLHTHTFTELTLWHRGYEPEDCLKSVLGSSLPPPKHPHPPRLRNDQSALVGSLHPNQLPAEDDVSIFGEFSENPKWWMTMSDSDRSQFFCYESWGDTGWDLWVWIASWNVKPMIKKHREWTFNTCQCWIALCHAAV